MALAAIFTGQVFAQAATPAASDDQTAKQTTTQVQTFGRFVDNNNDGICDNRGAMQFKGARRANFVDTNGDGICDYRAGSNFCRYNQTGWKGRGNGCCRGMSYQQRYGFGGPYGGQRGPVKN